MADNDFFVERSDRETIERLAQTLERTYTRTGPLIWRSFLQGFMSVIGGLAATLIILAILIYLFRDHGGSGLLQSWITYISDSIVRSQAQALQQAFK